jgi:hypothetical protein
LTVGRTTPRFTTVELASACTPAYPAPPELPPCPSPEKLPRLEGLIEVVLPSGISVRVDANVDARALRRVLGKRKLIPTVDGQRLGLQAGFGVIAAL